MKEKVYKILAINPGSTSTKLSVFENKKEIMQEVIRHDKNLINKFNIITEQKDMRKEYIYKFLKNNKCEITTIDAVVGRGGMIKPIESGTYEINESMIKDLNNSKASLHASSLGGLIASEIGKEHGIPSFIVDPVVVDELEPYSRLTGIPEISKESIFHALNAKSVAQKLAEEIGIKYEDLRLIVVHLGGGISVGAHRYGRVIDVNDGLQGDGPFTPERCGGVTLVPIIKMCFSGKYTQKEMEGFVTKNGGMFAYIGTNSLIEAEKMIMSGNKKASLVVESMAYQVCKEIGSMHVTLEGKVDAIILTGGLAYSDRFVGLIKDKVKFIAPVKVYPGENEMEALAQGALRVLKKEQKCKVYK